MLNRSAVTATVPLTVDLDASNMHFVKMGQRGENHPQTTPLEIEDLSVSATAFELETV